jgi:Peptidase inhibitor I78 family
MDLRTGVIAVLLTDRRAHRADGRRPEQLSWIVACGPLRPTAPPPAPSGSCDATKAQFALGERASQELLDRARVAAGAGVARFIRPNEPITLEFSPARLNLNLNTKDVVQSVDCG